LNLIPFFSQLVEAVLKANAKRLSDHLVLLLDKASINPKPQSGIKLFFSVPSVCTGARRIPAPVVQIRRLVRDDVVLLWHACV